MTKPSDTLRFKYINPKDPSGPLTDTMLFMSMNMLQSVSAIVNNIANISDGSFNPMIQRAIMAELLAERDAYGDRFDDNFRPPNTTIEEATKVMDWVREHVLSFFLDQSLGLKNSVEGRIAELSQVSAFFNGSPRSVSPTPAAGPSEQPPTT